MANSETYVVRKGGEKIMKILNEKIDEATGDTLWDIEYNEEELELFTGYAKMKDQDVDKMDEGDIVQFAIVGIIKDQIIEREKDESE